MLNKATIDKIKAVFGDVDVTGDGEVVVTTGLNIWTPVNDGDSISGKFVKIADVQILDKPARQVLLNTGEPNPTSLPSHDLINKFFECLPQGVTVTVTYRGKPKKSHLYKFKVHK